MKSLMITVALALLLMASGCHKEVVDCEAHNWGNLRLLNSSSQDVRVYIDDSPLATLPIGDEVEFDHISAGYHTIHAEQINTQKTWDNYVTIEQCQRLNLAFTL
jgi:hypothetical protein